MNEVGKLSLKIKEMGGTGLRTGFDEDINAYKATCQVNAMPCEGIGESIESAMGNLITTMRVAGRAG